MTKPVTREILGMATMFALAFGGAYMIGLSGCPGTESAIGLPATRLCEGWDFPSIEFIVGALMMIFAIPVMAVVWGRTVRERIVHPQASPLKTAKEANAEIIKYVLVGLILGVLLIFILRFLVSR